MRVDEVPVLLLISGVCLVNCQHFESEKSESGEHSTCYEDIKVGILHMNLYLWRYTSYLL